jgi:lipopolysaccharide biosynthesis protein
MRLIAFYLPQFHPIPENDLWWGKGFTEWTNVSKATPLFDGHYQPHLPADLGFYDLRLEEAREQQAALAQEYGIYGFCYYYYWFNGRRLLERPLNDVLRLKRPHMPFCVCWANEPWSRNWDGNRAQILMPQEHTRASDERFILDLLPILRDDRYIRVNGRPLVLIYRTELFPDIGRTALRWRELAFKSGLDLYLCKVESFGNCDPADINFDAACEFPPNFVGMVPENPYALSFHQPFSGNIYDYYRLVTLMLHRGDPCYKRFLGTMPSWDNTARSGSRAGVFVNSSSDLFRHWLISAICKTAQLFVGDEQIVFINAWNEWAEGCHLEPDRRYGHAFLEACQVALEAGTGAKSIGNFLTSWEASVPYTVLR